MLAMRQDQDGFTMIELMIGVVIVALLFSVGAPSFTTWTQNSQIRTAAESISAGLQLARSEAVRRNTYVTFTLIGYGAPNEQALWTVGCKLPVPDPAVPTPSFNNPSDWLCPPYIQHHLDPEGTSNALVNASIGDISFDGVGRASNTLGNVLTVRITNQVGGSCEPGPMRCLDVRVTPGGQIRVCNPSLPSTNPQGC